jgi:hypothetical protein
MSSLASYKGLLGLRGDVVSAVLDEGAVLLDLSTKYFYSVNSPGWAIVQLFENGATVEEARAQCRTWAGEGQSGDAVDRFIEALVADKLVTEVPNPARKQNVTLKGEWASPIIEKHKEPLQRVITSAFDPSIPLVE